MTTAPSKLKREGHPQSAKSEFASKLNWYRRQVLGAVSGVYPTISYHLPFIPVTMTKETSTELTAICSEAITLNNRLLALAQRIAELSRSDKWVK